MSKEKPIDEKKGIEANAHSTIVNVETVVLKDGTCFFVVRNVQGQVFKVCNTVDDLATFFSELINLGKNDK